MVAKGSASRWNRLHGELRLPATVLCNEIPLASRQERRSPPLQNFAPYRIDKNLFGFAFDEQLSEMVQRPTAKVGSSYRTFHRFRIMFNDTRQIPEWKARTKSYAELVDQQQREGDWCLLNLVLFPHNLLCQYYCTTKGLLPA
ncbi:hypothetical protein QTP88_014747 [Uroleucon formosanum]